MSSTDVLLQQLLSSPFVKMSKATVAIVVVIFVIVVVVIGLVASQWTSNNQLNQQLR